MLHNLGQLDPCVTVDEAIYKLVKQVQWTVPHLRNITVRLGGFHRAKHFTGVIGKIMKSTGFEEILSSAELFGTNQIEGNLSMIFDWVFAVCVWVFLLFE